LHVHKVNATEPFSIETEVLPAIPISTATTYTLKVSQQNNLIAIANSDDETIDVFDFDNATGELTNRRTSSADIEGLAYGVEFSPDGSQVYAAGYTRGLSDNLNPVLCQYTIDTDHLTHVGTVKYWTYTEADHARGGGLKLGPDGLIYVMQSYNIHDGVIKNPNDVTPLSERYIIDSIEMKVPVTSYALQFSTGLTRPSQMECNENIPPETNPDAATLCFTNDSREAKVNVLTNDTDPDFPRDTIYLTGAEFDNPADTVLAKIVVNPADSTVSLTIKPDADISVGGHEFHIRYHVKDNGIPASQCATGMLTITAYHTPDYPDIRIRICPDANKTVNLSKYLDTISTTNIAWESVSGIPIVTSAGTISTNDLKMSSTYTFTYTVRNICAGEVKRKVYLETLKPGRMRPLKDSIVICYRYAEALQLNQLFGIEARGTFSLDDTSLDIYKSVSTSSTHGGATVLNGKAIYEAAGGVTRVIVIYTPALDSCLKDETYPIKIVLTDDIVN
jgi:WD40 repeat protein